MVSVGNEVLVSVPQDLARILRISGKELPKAVRIYLAMIVVSDSGPLIALAKIGVAKLFIKSKVF